MKDMDFIKAVEFVGLLNELSKMMRTKISGRKFWFYQDTPQELLMNTEKHRRLIENDCIILDKTTKREFKDYNAIMYVDYEIISDYLYDDLHNDIISYWSDMIKRDFGFDICYRFYCDVDSNNIDYESGEIVLYTYDKEYMFTVTEDGWEQN